MLLTEYNEAEQAGVTEEVFQQMIDRDENLPEPGNPG